VWPWLRGIAVTFLSKAAAGLLALERQVPLLAESSGYEELGC
jgi:hypothetical protein